ncbi:glutamate-5-semialdehyde dehydrogenase [Bifidobacterium aquikefiri]|uniref:glutamate-5-semialdehyde dehydrogenase n=1 Tax=Bifidobacterium aquikefiri TaxID=1653207 RepID=UPI0039E8420D
MSTVISLSSSQSSDSAQLAKADASVPSARVLEQVCAMATKARKAQARLAQANSQRKNLLLNAIADALVEHADDIAAANELDMQAAFDTGMSKGLLDRLHFTVERIAATADGVRNVAGLPDPVGEMVRGNNLPNGLRLTQVRVPLGVVGMIYEARPNVTIDVASLTLKSGNAVLLRGGHAAQETNKAILRVIAQTLTDQGFSSDLVTSVDEFGRAGADALMQARGYIDLLVPRGGAGLIRSVVENSKVPVIETGAGNVHIYVDSAADLEKAVPIIINAKTQRVGVCNAAEKLLVHKSVSKQFLPVIARALSSYQVELHADAISRDIIDGADGIEAIEGLQLRAAEPEDWGTEYLALKMGIKTVDSMDAAIEHINRYSTGHTEAIISQDYAAIEEFTKRVDSAVVMVNASTRFTDGGMFGLGAELGISTQKLHARGPMGLQELTTTKWIGYGMGQIRP